ncbi:MAG: hypothetical protein V7739_13585 [Motiliproteus sp.]
MRSKDDEAGTFTVLIQRFNQQRYPRAKALKKRLDNGGCLSSHDIQLLQRVIADCYFVLPQVRRNPHHQSLAAKAITLYTGLIKQGLENQRSQPTR